MQMEQENMFQGIVFDISTPTASDSLRISFTDPCTGNKSYNMDRDYSPKNIFFSSQIIIKLLTDKYGDAPYSRYWPPQSPLHIYYWYLFKDGKLVTDADAVVERQMGCFLGAGPKSQECAGFTIGSEIMLVSELI